MKKIILIIPLTVFTIICFGQKKNPDNSIKLNTRFTLSCQTTDSINYETSIKSQEAFDKEVEMNDVASLFDKSINSNEIQGILTYGKFGSKTNIFLILKSGIKSTLSFELKIKVPNKRQPIKTSVNNLYSNIPSTEIWPYQIDYILFSNINAVDEITDLDFQTPMIDSTCIKNSNLSFNYDSIFTNYIQRISCSLSDEKGFSLNNALFFEKSIQSKDVTRKEFSTVSEGIYPNKLKYKLEKPLVYQHIECPNFESDFEYYYTKSDRLVKLVLFEWNEFKTNGIFSNNENDLTTINAIFNEKFRTISTTLTDLFGKPIYLNIESEKETETNYRDDIKWESVNGVKAYLFMFGNKNSSYRQIRLAIYKD